MQNRVLFQNVEVFYSGDIPASVNLFWIMNKLIIELGYGKHN